LGNRLAALSPVPSAWVLRVFTGSCICPLVSPLQRRFYQTVIIKACEACHFRDRTDGHGVIVLDRPLPSGRTPNHMLTFRPRPRKLPETRKTTDPTEQAP